MYPHVLLPTLMTSDLTESPKHPRWMSICLWAAATYNLVWGTWVITRPMDLFDWTGIPHPTYPGIWQCVGMIVGVYGIGYAIAATDPFRHWPIVLVGFLGKTFGPIGMLYNFIVLSPDDPSRLPWSWAWLNVTNDLVWWLPFAAILYLTFKQWNSPNKATQPAGESAAQANERFRSQRGATIAELSKTRPVLVVFLRHSGCTFCREALDDLQRQRPGIESGGCEIVLVHMGDNRTSESFFAAYQLQDLHRVSDPECELYRAYELSRGKVGQLFGPSVWVRGFMAAIVQRHGVGTLGGDGFQMPGTFLVKDNAIVKAIRHTTAASRPDYCDIVGTAPAT